jgi:hypothetical protein
MSYKNPHAHDFWPGNANMQMINFIHALSTGLDGPDMQTGAKHRIKHVHLRPLLDMIYLLHELMATPESLSHERFCTPEQAKRLAELVNAALGNLLVNNEGCMEAFRYALFCEPTMEKFRYYLRSLKNQPSPALIKCRELHAETETLKAEIAGLKAKCAAKDQEIVSLKTTVAKYGQKLGFFKRMFA